MRRSLVLPVACLSAWLFSFVQPAIGAQSEAAETEALRSKGVLLYKQGRYEEALVELLAAWRSYEARGDHSGAGWTLHFLGAVTKDYESGEAADRYWSRGLAEMEAAGDRRGEAQLLYDRASVTRRGPERAPALQRALKLAREIGDARTEGQALLAIGQDEFWAGRYAVALQTFHEALERFERSDDQNFVALVLAQLGRLHESHGAPERARVFYKRALDLFQKLGDKEGASQALSAVINMHRASGQLRQAVAAARQAVALRMEMGGLRRINIERVRLAHLYLARGDHGRAKVLLDEVMAGTDAYTRDLAYDPLAEMYLARGEYEKAREAADLAARVTREPSERPFMLANRARADEKLGQHSLALAGVDEALQIVEQSRTQLVPTDSMRQGYGERLQRLFAFAVELRMRLGRHEAALEAAEQARARAFLDLLAARESRTTTVSDAGAGVPTGGAGSDPTIDSLASASGTPASVGQLAAIARRLDSVIVSYWVGRGSTLVWVVNGDGRVSAASIRVSAGHLASLVGQTAAETAPANMLARGDPLIAPGRASFDAWRELHRLLIRPVQRFLPPTHGSLLTIVPHGPLFRLSFAALVDERNTHLLERYRLHYVPSGGSLLYLRSRPGLADRPPRYLLVADPNDRAKPSTAGLPPLPGATHEVAAIAKALHPAATTVLTGGRATEDRVRRQLSGQTVVHLATHGLLRDDRPLDSYLALAGRGRDAANDGRLTTEDIYGLHLDADLIVLSACRSARGPVTGDGVLGMTRAFMYAGTPSVIATLWDVADQSAAELMPAFYRTWRRGGVKSAALRDAQLQLLSRLRDSRVTIETSAGARVLPNHPFFWAGFVLVGEP